MAQDPVLPNPHSYGFLPLNHTPILRGRLASPSPRAVLALSSVERLGTRYSGAVDRDEMLQVLRSFEDSRLEYVLIGAAAMGFHGIVRATEAFDLLIRANPENVERLKQAFRRVYSDDPNVDEISADDLLGEYPAVRYYPPRGDLYFDVMTRLGDAAAFDTVESTVIEVEGIRVPVATPHALYRLKKDTVRPLDRQDAQALRRQFDLEEE